LGELHTTWKAINSSRVRRRMMSYIALVTLLPYPSAAMAAGVIPLTNERTHYTVSHVLFKERPDSIGNLKYVFLIPIG
jgi:hypothetical protein